MENQSGIPSNSAAQVQGSPTGSALWCPTSGFGWGVFENDCSGSISGAWPGLFIRKERDWNQDFTLMNANSYHEGTKSREERQ